MTGVAQVWLTDRELDALLTAAFTKGSVVSAGIGDALRVKLLAAQSGVACRVPPRPCSVCRNVRNKADGSVSFCPTCGPDLVDGGW